MNSLPTQVDGERVVSQLTLLELTSIYARAELEKPILLATYSIRRFGASIIETDLNNDCEKKFKIPPHSQT